MTLPYRDAHAAALARADRLERENEDLRRRSPARPRALRFFLGGLGTALVTAVLLQAAASTARVPPPAPPTILRYVSAFQSVAGASYMGPSPEGYVGPGLVRLEVDPSTGRVEGATSGALGALRVSGVIDGRAVRATLTRAPEADDDGLSGTLVGEIVDAEVRGTIRVSNATADMVRVAALTKP